MRIIIACVYEERSESRAARILVDRLWPRGSAQTVPRSIVGRRKRRRARRFAPGTGTTGRDFRSSPSATGPSSKTSLRGPSSPISRVSRRRAASFCSARRVILSTPARRCSPQCSMPHLRGLRRALGRGLQSRSDVDNEVGIERGHAVITAQRVVCVACDRYDVDGIRLVRMGIDCESEVGRQVPAHLCQVSTPSSLRITFQCFLREQHIGTLGMQGELMHAVSNEAIRVRDVVRLKPDIGGIPCQGS